MELKARRREKLFNKINLAYEESDGETMDKICCDHGITFGTYANYRKEFGKKEKRSASKPQRGGNHRSRTEYNSDFNVELVKNKSHKPRSESHKRPKKKYDKSLMNELRGDLQQYG